MNQRLQSCPTCVTVQCCSDNPFNYSLVNGPVYGNDQQSIDFTCPPGFQCVPGVYTVPANTIRYTPQPEASVLRIQCCQSEIVRQVPAGATDSQIGAIATDMVNACALQLAYCQANQFVRRSFQNEEVCQSPCAADGKLIGWFTPSPPPLVPAVRATVNQICVKGGVFSSQVSQSDANAKATQFLTAYIATLFGTGAIACGYWNTEQTVVCEDTTEIVVPAFTFFSTTSQAAANAAAVAYGQSQCEVPSECFDPASFAWSLDFQNDPDPPPGSQAWTGSGADFTIEAFCGDWPAGSGSNSNIQIRATATYTGTATQITLNYTENSVGADSSGSNIIQLFVNGGEVPPDSFEPGVNIVWTIPESVDAVIEFVCFIYVTGGTESVPQASNYEITGAFTVVCP